jgi:glycosyltransferase EpsE
MTDKNATISILMGIYNCAETLSEAIDSILAQTYPHWKLIMCDDGSVDDTCKIAQQYAENYPKKIILIKNEKNMGLNYTLNHCLKYADTEYVARMDGDDISLPERFEKQIEFLQNNPQYSIVSCPMIYFDENGDWGRGFSTENPIKYDFINGVPFCHAPCMIKTDTIKSVNGYSTNPKTLRAEDYNLWFRLYAKGYLGHNLQTPYYKMRDDMNAYKRRKFKFALNEAYVRFTGYKMLKLPLKAYIYVLRPIIVALLPKKLYLFLHHKKKS